MCSKYQARSLYSFPGVSRPRINSVTGTPLPSPRIVSTVIHPDISNLHTRYTLMVMQFAQFLDHELTMTPIHKGKSNFLEIQNSFLFA